MQKLELKFGFFNFSKITNFVLPFAIISLGLLMMNGCGKISTTTTTDTSTEQTTGATALDEAVDSLSEDSSFTASTRDHLDSTLDKSSKSSDYTIDRTCTATGGVATVTETWSGGWTKINDHGRASVDATVTATGTQTRVWTPPTGQSLSCHATIKRAKIRWLDDTTVNGLKLEVTIDRTKSRSMTITTPKVSKSKSQEVIVKGLRSISWATGTTTATTVTRTKTITSAVTRTVTTTVDSVPSVLAFTIATKSGADLSVEVTRLITDGSLTSKTIKTGTLVLTKTDGSRVETAFDGVAFDLTADDPCQPTAGTITASTFAKDATTATSTYSIQFGSSTDSGVSFTGSDGAVEDAPDITIQGCDLASSS